MKDLSYVFSKVKTNSPFLYYTVLIYLIAIIPCIIGLMVDERMLMGANVWTKPLKFALSQAIYVTTVGFFITFYPYSSRKKSIINNTVAFTLLVEFFIIIYQAYRGVKSHYNFDTEIDSLLFAIMGIFVGINVLIMVLFIIDTMRKKLEVPKVIQWAILLGWIIVFFGSWIGGQMIGQMSHNIGIDDGGAGLPILNWSTIAGDLRVAHFFGLHGLQIIPLFALILSKKWQTNHKNLVIGVTLFALLYASWIGYTLYQAKQGMPFIGM
jgi:hypothetical protein